MTADLTRLLARHVDAQVACDRLCSCGVQHPLGYAAHLAEVITEEFLVVPRGDMPAPIGYLGLIKRPTANGYSYDSPGGVWPSPPLWWIAQCRTQTRVGPMEFVIGEVREVSDGS